jgi:hypothetical protein
LINENQFRLSVEKSQAPLRQRALEHLLPGDAFVEEMAHSKHLLMQALRQQLPSHPRSVLGSAQKPQLLLECVELLA